MKAPSLRPLFSRADWSSRLTATASASPMAVPSSIRPIFTRSSCRASQAWSVVRGARV